MNAKVRSIVGSLAMAAWAVVSAIAFAQPQPPRAPAAAPARAVATVGTQRISAAEFERRVQMAQRELGDRMAGLPAEALDLLRRQVLESVIRLELLKLEAKRTGRLVPLAEAEAALRRDPFFNPNGAFDDRRWVLARTQQPEQFRATVADLQAQLSAQRMNAELEQRLAPTTAQLRADAERELTRVSVEHLSLKLADFGGRFPEPREAAVRATYERERSRMRRPDRATLTVVFVNTPGLDANQRADASVLRAWTARMRQSADSLIAAVQGGAELEELAIPHGGVRPRVVVTPDDFPRYWLGDAAQRGRLLRAGRGVFPEAVPAPEGFLVVRVDQFVPAHEPTLAEVARELRSRLREDLRDNHELYAQRDLYAQLRDSLAGPAWRVRWTVVDTAAVRVPEPSPADLDSYYRSRLADYSYFDSQQGRIVARALAEVRDDVRGRWLRDRRVAVARTQADELYRAWSARRRQPGIERALGVRESGPVPEGAELADGEALGTLSDTVWARGVSQPVGLARLANGFLVWWLHERVDRHVPTFEQAREGLRAALERQRELEEERGARALFAAEPTRFGSGEVIHFGRAMILPSSVQDVPLREAEVERHYRNHLDDYGAPELVRVRHILVEFRGQNDAARRAARLKAEDLLTRIRAGEDFVRLAQEHSDDLATRADGGDLGVVGRGTLLPPIEAVAFAMREGQTSDLVETGEGFHILRCTEYVPAVYQPLHLIYTNVAADLAQIRAESLAVQRADSLVRAHRSAARLERALRGAGFEVLHATHRRGQLTTITATRGFLESVEATPAGQVVRPPFRSRGQGVWVAWIDSITPPVPLTWEEARLAARSAHRLGAGQRALAMKRAELDSMLLQGVSADSLAAHWGGWETLTDLQRGRGIAGLGGPDRVDSLVFGSAGSPALPTGTLSEWLTLPNGIARLRIASREYPAEQRLRPRIEAMRREAVESGLREHFARLQQRYPVRILDPVLRDTPLPDPTARSTARMAPNRP